MSTLKTQENDASVEDFINSIDHPQKEHDARTLVSFFEAITGKPPRMWGNSIIGFGKYTYENTAKGGQWPVTGFSPRKSALSVYIMPGFDSFEEELAALGKHKIGKSCLYINRLDDINIDVLEVIVAKSIAIMSTRYPLE
ncbi:DUF1801 domain-containing protein [Thalassotalea euphylliae]|uniref:DUF1801 domain-containing protein n=1 Tax=Thalassotalea euphylliae TaxID=1655234 RepID=UPI0036316112